MTGTVRILNYPLFSSETERFHTVFHIREDEGGFLWSNRFEIHLIDLSNFMVQWKKYRRKLKEQNHQELPLLMMLSAADVQRKKLDEEMLAELEEWAMNMEEVREALIEWENLSSKKKNRRPAKQILGVSLLSTRLARPPPFLHPAFGNLRISYFFLARGA